MAARTRVQVLNPLDEPQWDEQLAACSGASFFHQSAWARVLHATYGFRPLYFVRSGGAGTRDILPMMEVETWLTPRRGISLPFTDGCAPLCATHEGFHQLLSSLQSHAAERRWRSWELRGGCERLVNATPSISYYTHTLDLQPRQTTLFSCAASATRRAIRKAQTSGLTVSFSESREAVGEFYNLLCRTRRRLGAPPQPFSFFANIHEHVISRHDGWVVLASQADVPVAGAMYFHAGKTAHYKFGASDDRFQHLRANNLVMWSAIQLYAGSGYETFDFGRTSLANEGLRRFKLSWGATEQRIDYVKYDFRRRAFTTQPDGSGAGLHTKLFRLLPPPMLRVAGRLLYKHAA